MKCLCKAKWIQPPSPTVTDYKPLVLASKGGRESRVETTQGRNELHKGNQEGRKARFKLLYLVRPQWAFRVFRWCVFSFGTYFKYLQEATLFCGWVCAAIHKKITTLEVEILKDGAFLELRPSIAVDSERELDLILSFHKYFQRLSFMVTHITMDLLEMVHLNHKKHGSERRRERKAEETRGLTQPIFKQWPKVISFTSALNASSSLLFDCRDWSWPSWRSVWRVQQTLKLYGSTVFTKEHHPWL